MAYAILTGASKGIGKSIAFELASRKKDLLLLARNEEALHSLAAELQQKFGIRADYLSIDLSQQGAAQKVLQWTKSKGYPVEAVINNAGFGLAGAFDQSSLNEHLNMIQLNVTTLVEFCHVFLPELQSQKRGYILNIASSAAYQAIPYLSAYAASKSFVLQFSRGLSVELKGTGVSVTCVSPGATDTEWVERAKIPKKGLDMAKKVNMKPEEVAKIAVDAMYSGKTEVITGILNKLGAALSWLLPKRAVENATAKMYQ